jgi:hypothetical protein
MTGLTAGVTDAVPVAGPEARGVNVPVLPVVGRAGVEVEAAAEPVAEPADVPVGGVLGPEYGVP